MRNRPFVLQVQKSDPDSESPEPGKLKNKFSGKTLFRSNLYHLVTGSLTILDIIDNQWFFRELFEYSSRTHDPNIIPALKKIASTTRFDESLRQRASEITENIEEHIDGIKGKASSKPAFKEEEKADEARLILSGVRSPQTTEVLRLLRDKSTELKRLAIWMIGKFRITDLSQEVCESIVTPGIESDALTVLTTLGQDAARELKAYYLTSSGNIEISKAILRLFGKSCPDESLSFLVERLWSNSRQIKELALRSLIACGYKPSDDEKEHFGKLIYDTFGVLAWIISCKVCLADHENQDVLKEMNKEYDRWEAFLAKLLLLIYGEEISPVSGKTYADKKEDVSMIIPELAEIVYGGHKPSGRQEIPDHSNDKRMLKKLQPYFPVVVPAYNELMEDIINHDYNIIGIWTKACTIRNIGRIESDNMGESLIALLFSPEGILREESARLLSRSGSELYRISSDRIHDTFRKKLDRIVSGETESHDLIFEKVCFLSTCFPKIKEDELIFLGEQMVYFRNTPLGLSMPSYSSIIWTFRDDSTEPDVIISIGNNDQTWNRKNMLNACSYCYILPLNSIEEFDFQYPEDSYGILRYIDEHEG